MQFMKALAYPFSKKHFNRVALTPALIQLAASLVFLGIVGGALFLTMPSISHMALKDQMPTQIIHHLSMSMIGITAGAGLLFMLMNMVVAGYYWELAYQFQLDGLQAVPPAWRGRMKEHFVAGFQSFAASLILFTPIMILTVVSLGLLTPFMITPYLMAAREKTIKSVFQSLVPSIPITLKYYVPVSVGMLASIIVSTIFSLISSFLSFTVVTPMCIASAMIVFSLAVITEQYNGGLNGDKSSQKQKKPINLETLTAAQAMAAIAEAESNTRDTEYNSPLHDDPSLPDSVSEMSGEAVMVYTHDKNISENPSNSGDSQKQLVKANYFVHKGDYNPWRKS